MKKIWMLAIMALSLAFVGCSKDEQSSDEQSQFEGVEHAELKLTLTVSEDARKFIKFSGYVKDMSAEEDIVSSTEIEEVNNESPKVFTVKTDLNTAEYSMFSFSAEKRDDIQAVTEHLTLSYRAEITVTVFDKDGKMLCIGTETLQKNLSGNYSEELIDSFVGFFPDNRSPSINKTSEGYEIRFGKAH